MKETPAKQGSARRPLAGFAGAFAAVLVVVEPVPAAADPAFGAVPRAAALSWVREPGAEECPAGPAIGAEVERVLGGTKLAPISQADLVIEGRVARAGDGFETVLTVTLPGGAVIGTRKIASPGPSCSAITAEIGLVVALMIDPDAALRPATPPVAPPPFPINPAAPSLAGPACPPSFPAAAPIPEVPWKARLSLGAVIGAGLTPSPGIGARARVALTPPHLFPLEIGGEIFAPVRVEQDGHGVDVTFAQAFVRACPVAPTGALWAFAACGGLDVGSVHGAGFGFSVNRASELLVVAAAVGARLDVHLVNALHVSLGTDIAAPFLRGRFYYDTPAGVRREAFLTSPIAGTVDLALGVALP